MGVTVTVAGEQAAALPHPSCRPLVQGLLAVLDDPALGADPATTRHAWAAVDLVAPIPIGVDLAVRAEVTGTARLGAGDGVWIDVDVDGPDGAPLLRSRHAVAARLVERPGARCDLPRIRRARGAASESGRLAISVDALAAYRVAAGDSSVAHDDGAAAPIVPGLLTLWTALRAVGADPRRVEARFPAPLAVGVEAVATLVGSNLGVGTATGPDVVRAVLDDRPAPGT